MGGPSRAQAVDRLERDVDGGVAADGNISPEEVVVDRGCNADHVNPELAKHVGACLGSVAANHHHTIDAALGEIAKRLGTATLLAEFRGSRTAEKRPADLNDAAHVAGTELSELTFDETLPTLEHSVDRHALIERTARNSAYRRIHTGGIATARQDRDVLHKTEIMPVRPGNPWRQEERHKPASRQPGQQRTSSSPTRFTINRFDLGDGPDPGIVNSQNDCDQISFRGLPCSEAPLKEKLMSLAERLDTIRQGADKRIPPDKRAIMHRATDDLRASGILNGVIKVGDPLPPFTLKNAFGQEVRSSELLANGKLVLTVFRGSW